MRSSPLKKISEVTTTAPTIRMPYFGTIIPNRQMLNHKHSSMPTNVVDNGPEEETKGDLCQLSFRADDNTQQAHPEVDNQ